MKNQNIFVALGWHIIKKAVTFLTTFHHGRRVSMRILFFQINIFQKDTAHKENVQSRNTTLILAKLVLFGASLSQLAELFS